MMDKKIELGSNILDALDNNDFNFLEKAFQIRDVMEVTSKEHWNWLHKALSGFNSSLPSRQAIQYLIDKGVNVNSQDCYGMTPLHYAMRAKNIEAAIVLLNAGADPNIPDRDQATALAYINGMPEELALLKLMLEKGGDVNFNNGQHGILEGIKKYRSENPKFKPVIELMEKYT